MDNCFKTNRRHNFVYQSPDTLQQLQQGGNLNFIVLQKIKQLHEGLCFRNQFIQEILPIKDENLSQISLIYDRTGNIIYQVCAETDVVCFLVPELILVNCQIKEVNQRDDDIVQLICKGFGDLINTNIYVFIDNINQTTFQVDQYLPVLLRRSIYQVGCPNINCFAQPMQPLDSQCYFAFIQTPKDQQDDAFQLKVEEIQYNISFIDKLGQQLAKINIQLLNEFLAIFSNNTAQIPKTNDQTAKVYSLKQLFDLCMKPPEDDSKSIMYIKTNIQDYTLQRVQIIESIKDEYLAVVHKEIDCLVEISKEMLFWLRFLFEATQVYGPKQMTNLKNILQAKF